MNHGIRLNLGAKMATSLCPQRAAKFPLARKGFLDFVAVCSYNFVMARDTVVRARIDGHVKEEATSVLDKMGLSVSDAIRMLLIRVAREKALPFDVRVPNAETAAAIEEARQGKLESFDSVGKLIKDLNEDDSADESL